MVLTDGSIEYHALGRVVARFINKVAPVTDAFCRDQNTLSVHSVQNHFEPCSLRTQEVLLGDSKVIEKEFAAVMIDHGLNGPDLKALSFRLTDVN